MLLNFYNAEAHSIPLPLWERWLENNLMLPPDFKTIETTKNPYQQLIPNAAKLLSVPHNVKVLF